MGRGGGGFHLCNSDRTRCLSGQCLCKSQLHAFQGGQQDAALPVFFFFGCHGSVEKTSQMFLIEIIQATRSRALPRTKSPSPSETARSPQPPKPETLRFRDKGQMFPSA